MRKRMIALGLIGLSILVLAVIGYAFYSSVTIHVQGNIAMLRVFEDAQCTTLLTEIDFGDLGVGDTITSNFYVKNFASAGTTLALDLSNVTPTNLLEYASVTWNRDDYYLPGGAIVAATLSMTIYENASELSGAFDYDINVFTSMPQDIRTWQFVTPARATYYANIFHISDANGDTVDIQNDANILFQKA